jgi:DNA-binding transcriptional regulator YiaG
MDEFKNLKIRKDTHMKFKAFAASMGKTTQDLADAAITEYMNRRNKDKAKVPQTHTDEEIEQDRQDFDAKLAAELKQV